MSKLKTVVGGKRDKEILRFLWRWKLASTATLAAKFYAGQQPILAYNRLLTLKHAGFLAMRADESAERFYWTLTKMGFKAVRGEIDGLKEEGFRSEYVQHDALVTALHLGDWLTAAPADVRFFSEQQLRRLHPELYPNWVPRSDDHRPDGYWGIATAGGVRPVALEVELSRKEGSAYEAVADYYADEVRPLRVLWLVPAEIAAARIQENLAKAAASGADLHDFVLLPAFQERCWGAPIVRGPGAGLTVAGLLDRLRGKGHEKPLRTAWDLTANPLLDARKSPVRSRASSFTLIAEKRD